MKDDDCITVTFISARPHSSRPRSGAAPSLPRRSACTAVPVRRCGQTPVADRDTYRNVSVSGHELSRQWGLTLAGHFSVPVITQNPESREPWLTVISWTPSASLPCSARSHPGRQFADRGALRPGSSAGIEARQRPLPLERRLSLSRKHRYLPPSSK
jgi:hypothetical protein